MHFLSESTGIMGKKYVAVERESGRLGSSVEVRIGVSFRKGEGWYLILPSDWRRVLPPASMGQWGGT